MQIEKPVFIIGSGRSGTTVLYNLLALHPDLCWISTLTTRYPAFSALPAAHRLLDMPLIGSSLKKRIVDGTGRTIRPSEAREVYHDYCGFTDSRKMTENDLTPDMEARLKKVIHNHLKYAGKPRFLNKRTANTQRIRAVHQMFPDALYIHVIRDGRAVAHSLSRVYWWNDIDLWWLDQTREQWLGADREPIELCGAHWQRDVQELLLHKHLYGDRYMELRYEDLIVGTHGVLQRIVQFCGLTDSPTYIQSLPPSLPDMNLKWRTQLTEHQKERLQAAIGDFLTSLGYTA